MKLVLAFSIIFIVFLGYATASNTALINDKDWHQATDTVGDSYNDVDAIFDTSTDQ